MKQLELLLCLGFDLPPFMKRKTQKVFLISGWFQSLNWTDVVPWGPSSCPRLLSSSTVNHRLCVVVNVPVVTTRWWLVFRWPVAPLWGQINSHHPAINDHPFMGRILNEAEHWRGTRCPLPDSCHDSPATTLAYPDNPHTWKGKQKEMLLMGEKIYSKQL